MPMRLQLPSARLLPPASSPLCAPAQRTDTTAARASTHPQAVVVSTPVPPPPSLAPALLVPPAGLPPHKMQKRLQPHSPRRRSSGDTRCMAVSNFDLLLRLRQGTGMVVAPSLPPLYPPTIPRITAPPRQTNVHARDTPTSRAGVNRPLSRRLEASQPPRQASTRPTSPGPQPTLRPSCGSTLLRNSSTPTRHLSSATLLRLLARARHIVLIRLPQAARSVCRCITFLQSRRSHLAGLQ